MLQTLSTIDVDVSPTDMFPAEVAVTGNGRFMYVSNRDASSQRRDSIALFSLDEVCG